MEHVQEGVHNYCGMKSYWEVTFLGGLCLCVSNAKVVIGADLFMGST